MKFADKVFYLRKKRGLTQEELAKLTNLSQGTIALYENNKMKPKGEALIQLSKVLSIKPEILIDDERSVTE